jgi:hypothetical protein
VVKTFTSFGQTKMLIFESLCPGSDEDCPMQETGHKILLLCFFEYLQTFFEKNLCSVEILFSVTLEV